MSELLELYDYILKNSSIKDALIKEEIEFINDEKKLLMGLGILNEIVKLRDILTTYMIIYAKNGNFRRSMADAMVEVANNNKDNENVYCFDLNQNMLDQMLKLMDQMGYDEFKTEYFADNTHQTEKGARWVLSLIIDLIKNSDCDLKNYIK